MDDEVALPDSNCSDIVSCCNPTSDEITEDIEKIKGDAIGDTLYSEIGVLKILMKLTQIVDKPWDEEIESELCLLWDMSLEKDVVDFLVQHNFMNLSMDIMKASTNIRLIEILVGIHGNISCVLKSNYPKGCLEDMILILYTSDDPPTLIQVVRLLQAVSWNPAGGHHWLDSYEEIDKLSGHLAFLLASSTNEELIICCLEFINTVCRQINDTDYSHFFATPEMLGGLLECWKQLFADWTPEDDLPSKTHEKAATNWTAILASFTAHQPGRSCLCDFGEQLGTILSQLCIRKYQCEDYILMSSIAVLEAIVKVYFSGAAFKKILETFHSAIENNDMGSKEDIEEDSLFLECMSSFCESVALNIESGVLNQHLSQFNENHVLLFWKTVQERRPDPEPGQRVL